MSTEILESEATPASIKLSVHGKGETANQSKPAIKRQYVNFSFFKARPEWRLLSDEAKHNGRREFLEAVDKFSGDIETNDKLLMTSYSLTGLRTDADFMIWRIGYDLEPMQQMTAEINRTGLGKYLDATQSFLSMTKRSMYIDREHPTHVEDRLHVVPGTGKYLFVYPFVKTRPWYMLSWDERQAMMDDHIRVGTKYTSVKLHTTYSFGLDDQEFVVAFETEHPSDFLDLVQELRETKASMYTLRDTPMYTCRKMDLAACLDALG